MRDIGPLILSLLAMTLGTFVLGIVLIPDWEPELIPVLGGAAVALTLVSQVMAATNAIRRRELVWLVVVLLTGPLGVMAYGLIASTRSGEFSRLLEELADHNVGKERR
jgi:hypothetical protein